MYARAKYTKYKMATTKFSICRRMICEICSYLYFFGKIPGSWDFAKSRPGNPGIENSWSRWSLMMMFLKVQCAKISTINSSAVFFFLKSKICTLPPHCLKPNVMTLIPPFVLFPGGLSWIWFLCPYCIQDGYPAEKLRRRLNSEDWRQSCRVTSIGTKPSERLVELRNLWERYNKS